MLGVEFAKRVGSFGGLARQPSVDVMRILLQHVRTQLYLRSLGNWTANPLEGYDFQHSQRAVDFAREHGIGGVQIAVKFLDGQFDEAFPLSANSEITVATKLVV